MSGIVADLVRDDCPTEFDDKSGESSLRVPMTILDTYKVFHITVPLAVLEGVDVGAQWQAVSALLGNAYSVHKYVDTSKPSAEIRVRYANDDISYAAVVEELERVIGTVFAQTKEAKTWLKKLV